MSVVKWTTSFACFTCVVLIWRFQAFLSIYDADTLEKKFLMTSHAGDKSKQTAAILPERFQRRRENMLRACEARPRPYILTASSNVVKKRILLDRKHGLMFCSIQKIASTYWRHILKEATMNKVESLVNVGQADIRLLLQNSTKFLFVRDPYHRLLSCYVDKFLSPNTIVWKQIGTRITRYFRKTATERELRCGHNVTFSEMVKFFIFWMKNQKKIDGHFSPEYAHCDPCSYRFDVIGKFETFEEDTQYIMKRFGLTSRLIPSLNQSFHEQHLTSTIEFEFKKLFRFYNYNENEYHSCISFSEAQNLVWKKLKINGLINRDFKLPTEYIERANISQGELVALAKRNIDSVLDKVVSRRNREESFLEAYSTLDKADLNELAKIFKPDCDIFGYDCKPHALFHQN